MDVFACDFIRLLLKWKKSILKLRTKYESLFVELGLEVFLSPEIFEKHTNIKELTCPSLCHILLLQGLHTSHGGEVPKLFVSELSAHLALCLICFTPKTRTNQKIGTKIITNR